MDPNPPENERLEPMTSEVEPAFILPAPVAEPELISAPPVAVHNGNLGKAIALGLGTAIFGTLLYAIVDIGVQTLLAKREQNGYVLLTLGFLLIKSVGLLIGFVVGKAVLAGSGGTGGRKYQFSAVILTYLGISMASIFELLWQLHAQGADLRHASAGLSGALLEYGLFSPLLAVTTDITSGVLGLIVLGLAFWIAWRTAKARKYKL